MTLYVEGILIGVGVNVILALGYWLTANTRQFSLGHAGFMALGAYVSAILTVHYGWSLEPALVVAAVVTGVIGTLAALPGLRLSLLHLAMVTLAFGELIQIGFANWDFVGGVRGFSGMRGTTLPMVGVIVAAVLVYVVLYSRSRLGLNAAAVREDEVAAAAAGISVTAVKVSAFGQSALITGVGGALLGHHLMFLQPSNFGVSQSVVIILYVVFGGLYSVWGPVVGAASLTLLPELVDFWAGWFLIVYGALFVILMILRPEGLIRPKRLRGRSRLLGSLLYRRRRAAFDARSAVGSGIAPESARARE